MSAVDSGVAVAALRPWHEVHTISGRNAHGKDIPAHALVEAYAVLTRLSPPRRLDPRMAEHLLAAWLPADRVLYSRRGFAGPFLRRLADAGISGGASYDALVAAIALEHSAELVSRGGRAERTYRAMGVACRLVRQPSEHGPGRAGA